MGNEHNYLVNTYNRMPYNIVRGNGVWLYDDKDQKYLDALCGIAVTILGHNYPAVTEAIQDQAAKLIHISNLVTIPLQEQLAEMLSQIAGFKAKSFFNNSGAEAVETAIKLTRLYGHARNIAEPKIIVMGNAFHGRTMATIAAGGNKKVQAGFEPLMPGFVRAEFNNVDAVSNLVKQDPTIVAVMLEPVQGEGGILAANLDYLVKVRDLCTQYKLIMIVDEIQCGMARTGKMFAYQHANIQPDVITLAKGLANGVPIGACIINDKYADLFKPGTHGSTFGGNPLACRAAITVLNEIINNNLVSNAEDKGNKIITGLREHLSNHPNVIDIRGKGLMIGIELDRPCRDLLHLAFEANIIFNVTKENTIRLLPPLIVEDVHVARIIEIVSDLITKFCKN
jgi:acetylornithine/N-succinyldiaminopimelate aminotransferase